MTADNTPANLPAIDWIEILYRGALTAYIEQLVREQRARLDTATPETHLEILQRILAARKAKHAADRQVRTIENAVFNILDL